MTAPANTANVAGASNSAAGSRSTGTSAAASDAERAATVNDDSVTGAPACPKCGGKMWDNRATKRNPKAPDFKCRDRRCDGVLWPGQHKTAEPILMPRVVAPAADAPADVSEAATEVTTEAGQGSAPAPTVPTARRASAVSRDARDALRRCYLAVTDFVLSEIRPKYADAGLPCTDATVAAIAATLFIQTCRPLAGREGQ